MNVPFWINMSAHFNPLSCLPFSMLVIVCQGFVTPLYRRFAHLAGTHRSCSYVIATVYVFCDISWPDKITEEIRNCAARMPTQSKDDFIFLLGPTISCSDF